MIIVFFLISVPLAVACALTMYRFIGQTVIRRQARRVEEAGGISTVETVLLGGVAQRILLQSYGSDKPVLLMLHGGPGMPIPGVCCRGVDWVSNSTTEELRRHFTLVFWDQRGTGASYSPKLTVDSIHLEQFISDADELTDWLRGRFGVKQIFLAATSWGSVIGLKLAHRHPEKFHAYFGIAQIINWTQSDEEAYVWLLEQAKRLNKRKALRALTAMGEPPYNTWLRDWQQLRRWLMAFGGFIYKQPGVKNPVMRSVLSMLLRSPDYTLKEIAALGKGMQLSYSPRLMEDILRYDASADIHSLTLPVHFFHGRHDRVISGSALQQFYDRLVAPAGKQLTWLEQSAHMFGPADAKKVEKTILADASRLYN